MRSGPAGSEHQRWYREAAMVAPMLASGVGLALVGAGWFMVGRDYLPDLLLQVGSSLLLLIPLVILNRLLERRLERTEAHTRSISSDLADVRTQVRETAARIDTLGPPSRESTARVKEAREQALRRAEREPTAEVIAELLRYAAEIGATPADGPRVRMPERSLWLRFDAADDDVIVGVELRDGRRLRTVVWRRGVPVDQFGRQARELADLHDPDQAGRPVDIGVIVAALLRTLRTAVEARTGDSPRDLGAVVEFGGGQWVISTDGLRCVTRPYEVPNERLTNLVEDWRGHVSALPWVDRAELAEAWDTAAALARRRPAASGL